MIINNADQAKLPKIMTLFIVAAGHKCIAGIWQGLQAFCGHRQTSNTEKDKDVLYMYNLKHPNVT